MVNFGKLLQSSLLVLVMAAVAQSQVEKLATCCTSVSNQEITEPIIGYLPQKASPPCVRAIIFQTEKGLFCAQVTAPWVQRKIRAFRAAKAQTTVASTAPSSTVSLLSLITSTAPSSSSSYSVPSSSYSAPSSSSLPPSTPSASEIPNSVAE